MKLIAIDWRSGLLTPVSRGRHSPSAHALRHHAPPLFLAPRPGGVDSTSPLSRDSSSLPGGRSVCLCVDQTRAVPSREHVTSRRPQGGNDAGNTASAWPQTGHCSWTWSHSPPPRGSETMAHLQEAVLSCPAIVRRSSPERELNSLQGRSADTFTSVAPPGERATPMVPSACARRPSCPHRSTNVPALFSSTPP